MSNSITWRKTDQIKIQIQMYTVLNFEIWQTVTAKTTIATTELLNQQILTAKIRSQSHTPNPSCTIAWTNSQIQIQQTGPLPVHVSKAINFRLVSFNIQQWLHHQWQSHDFRCCAVTYYLTFWCVQINVMTITLIRILRVV